MWRSRKPYEERAMLTRIPAAVALQVRLQLVGIPMAGLRDMNPLTDHFFKKMVDGKGLFGTQLLTELAEDV
jgi:hypothetical protein